MTAESLVALLRDATARVEAARAAGDEYAEITALNEASDHWQALVKLREHRHASV